MSNKKIDEEIVSSKETKEINLESSNSHQEEKKKKWFFHFQRKYLAIPYILFMIFFVVLPILVVFYYAFTNSTGHFSFENVSKFFNDQSKVDVLVLSFVYGFANTAICLLIGYPIAYILANKNFNKNSLLVMMFIMPMWINFVIRTWATRDLLSWIGLGGGKYPQFATMVGLVSNYLPFVILPLHSTMLKMDRSQIEAAADLGASPVKQFTKVIIPMTMPGIVSAATMVFMPTMSSYVISDILSEGNVILFGKYIDQLFGQSDWHNGSFLALVMLALIGLSVLITRKFSKGDGEEKSNLW